MRASDTRTVVDDSLAELQASLPNINRIKVASVIIGVEYTGVRLSSGQVGLAYTLTSERLQIAAPLREGPATLQSYRHLSLLDWRFLGTSDRG